MKSKRQRQVAELVKRHFSIVLQHEGTYIYGAKPLVTVTWVDMSPDLGIAKIYLSIWNTENKQEVMLELAEAMPRLKKNLSSRIRSEVRILPDIQLYMDDLIDEMYQVDDLIDRIHKEDAERNPSNSNTPEMPE